MNGTATLPWSNCPSPSAFHALSTTWPEAAHWGPATWGFRMLRLHAYELSPKSASCGRNTASAAQRINRFSLPVPIFCVLSHTLPGRARGWYGKERY